tara:strand:+ start:32970 stop:33590 length:621 start_codon:yes stop_codon:yes gene_type:complete
METIPKPCLTLLTDIVSYGPIDLKIIEDAIHGGVDMLQLREPSLNDNRIIELGNLIAEITKNRALFILNGNPEVAAKINADGIQLPEKQIETKSSDISRKLLIGRSIHSKNAAIKAEISGADFLIAGNIFHTSSHPDRKPLGLQLITDVCDVTEKPVFGIGGVNLNNTQSIIKSGATGIAVISYIWESPNPENAARSMKEKMQISQ